MGLPVKLQDVVEEMYFQNETIKKIAIDFLDAEGIPWVDPEE